MKILKNKERNVCGIEYDLFSIIAFTEKGVKKYYYYLNLLLSNNVGDLMIYKSKTKPIVFNKYILSTLSIIYNILFFNFKKIRTKL